MSRPRFSRHNAGRSAIPYDRGLSDFEYWKSIADAAGVPLNQSTSDRLTSMDIEGWLNTDSATVEMLASLDEAGDALALLPTRLRRSPWSRSANLFFDDRQVNVDGALAAGLRSQLWLGAGQTPLN